MFILSNKVSLDFIEVNAGMMKNVETFKCPGPHFTF